ncbi:S-adenosyl-L-methionine-dependent methyltransferase [Circinella umbellata]|nr:S-adenosyl-L-methionine-dependent methyltransferase [Circinella umbellata]
MASQHSQAQVIGFDVRLPPEQTMTNLKNLRFVRMDIHDTWPLSDNTVDLIFQRSMAQHIKRSQWKSLLEEMFRVLKPGGYLELLELDPYCHNPGPVQKTFEEFAKTYWEELDIDFGFIGTIGEQLEQVGFEIQEEKELDIPIGEWPEESELKQFGFINKETKKAYLRNRKVDLINKWGIPAEDYDLAIQEIMDEFEEYHGFSRYTCWIVKKPL